MAFPAQSASPTLDGNPPPQPGNGPPQPPTLQQLSPSAQFGGGMQMVQMFMQALTEAAKLLDLCGQVIPSFAPTAQMLIEQMKGAGRASIQQGTAPAGASLAQLSGANLGGGPGSAAPAGPSQGPPPMLPSGLQQ